MQSKIIWQQSSYKPDNADNLALISQWWSNLANTQVTLAQRLIPQNGELDAIDWEPQRFDEVFDLKSPQIRGITVYWRKSDSESERSATPQQLVLDTRRQQLYIFPQSQNQLVIRVGLPEISYETVEINNPQIEYKQVGGATHLLKLRDNIQQIEVNITLNWENLQQLKQQLPS